MKVIEDGNNPWWAGVQSKCPICGRVVEFETRDGLNCFVAEAVPEKITYVCQNCGGYIIVKNPLIKDSK